VALALAGLGLVGQVSAGAATGVPTYEPDPGAVGTVSFFNSGGTQITSGAVGDAPMAAYYKASGPKTGAFAFNKGYAAFFTPVDGVTPAGWQTGDQSTPGQDFATLQAGYPAGLTNPATNAVIAGGATDFTLATHIAGFPSLSTLNPGVFQIRVYTSASADTYYAADVKVTGSTWSQVYPGVTVGAVTSTTLVVSPTGTAVAGSSVSLTATVSPIAAVGAVQFFDGSTPIGSPVSLTGGVASTSTSGLAVGAHSLTATFVPTDSTLFSGSSSSAGSLTVTSVPVTPSTTALVSTPPGPVQAGSSVSLSATVLPSNAPGQVQFYDGASPLGAPVPAITGSAVKLVGSLTSGSHSFKATFLPSSAAFGTSTSSPVNVTVTPAPATATNLGFVASPGGTVVQGTAVMLTATVSPNTAVGHVIFKDGASILGQANAVGGLAQLSVSTLVVGDHFLSANFVPTAVTDFLPSANTVSISVTAPPPGATTVAITFSPSGPVAQGTPATLTATVTPSTAAGTIQFLDADGTVPLGELVPVTSGVATLTLSTLAAGMHPLSAHFAPSGAEVLSSTSGIRTLIVTTQTTTSVQLSPAGPVIVGVPVLVTGTVTPAEVVGTLQVLDGTSVVGSGAVVSGQAVVSLSGLAPGSHSLRTRFTPADVNVFAGSTSSVVVLVVSPPPAVATTTTLSATPLIVDSGSTVTLRAAVTPSSAGGSVRFTRGTSLVAKSPVVGGSAAATWTAVTPGSYAIVATFEPALADAFQRSSSGPVQVAVAPFASLSVSSTSGHKYPSGSSLGAATVLVLRGSGFTPGELVSVTLRSTPTSLAQVTADSRGGMTTTLTLPSPLEAGDHTLTVASASTEVVFAFVVPTVSGSDRGATSNSSGGSSPLAGTGSSAVPLTAIGLLFLFIGGTIVLLARRSHPVSVSSAP